VKVKFIERNGRRKWAVLPYEDYLQLIKQAETNEDIQDYDRMIAAVESGEEDVIPAEDVYGVLDRRKRGYTHVHVNLEDNQLHLLDEIAKRARVSRSELVRAFIDAQLLSRSEDSTSGID
jgi:hypothetical protein